MNPNLRSGLPCLSLLLLPLALWVASSGKVAHAPVATVVLGMGLVIGIRSAFAWPRLGWFDFVLAALLGVAATHRLFFPGFPDGHDISHHLWGLYAFYREVESGNPFPRWIHRLGLGMPLLLFYPPLPFYALLPILALHLPVFDSFKYGLVLFSALSGVSMYWAMRRWTGDGRAALVAAGAYCFAPCHLLLSNYRNAMAEAAAMAILPFFFFSMAQALEAPTRRRWRRAALWTALLVMTHPLSLSMGGVAMGLFVLGWYDCKIGRPMFKTLGLLFSVAMTGVGLAAYYTLPVLAESQYADVKGAIYSGDRVVYSWHGLRIDQLLSRRQWTEYQLSEERGSEDEKDEMPFYFGLTFLALVPFARHPDKPELARALVALALGSLALTMYPLDIAFSWVPFMRILQFPWRFLSVATFGASALAGLATLHLLRTSSWRGLSRVVPGMIFGLLLLDFFPYGGAPTWEAPYARIWRSPELNLASLPLRVQRLYYPPSDTGIDLSLVRRAYPEYLTPEVLAVYRGSASGAVLERAAVGLEFDENSDHPKELQPAPYAEFQNAEGGGSKALPFLRGGGRIEVELPRSKGKLEVKEQWFPGWVARLDNREVEVGKTSDGLMAFDIPSGAGRLTLHFSRVWPWDRLVGIVVSLLLAVALWLPRGEWKAGGYRPA